MAQSSLSHRTIVKKSEHWHWHGKHRPILGWLVQQRREAEQRRAREPMFDTVQAAMAYAKQYPY